jgi:hypothetical protein
MVQAQLSSLPPELQERVEDLLATRFPPQLLSVELDPESPGADEAVTVTAEIQNDASITDDETSEAYIFFSADGGETWEEVEMETEDDKTWTAEIPGQESGATVIWGIRAVDSSSNFYTDLPCKVSEPVPYDGYKTCTEEEDCESALPYGCVFALASDESPIDDEDQVIPDDFDFQNFRIAYDDDNIYLDLVVQGKVSDGSASPMNIHGYVGVLINTDKGGNSTDLTELLSAGAIMLHAPLAKLAGGLVKPCFYGYQQGGDFVQDTGPLTCKDKGNHLFFTIKRDAIEDNPSNQLQFLGANASITSISPIAGGVYDNTRITQVNFIERSYEVE